MKYLSVCSGIEAATMAWHPLGWEPVAFSEIEAFPSAVLAYHYPDVINEGDFTKIGEKYDLTDGLICGGTPCQDFSVAGLRAGLDGERGNLSVEFVKLAYQSNAKWICWENVPGVLSSGSGQDFATILSGFTGCRVEVPKEGWRNAGIISGAYGCYSVAWRVLDAQFVRVDGFERAVPQRRRRVFIIGYSGAWQYPAAVLFERESLQGHSAPCRKKREKVAGTLKGGTGERGYPDPSDGNGGGLVPEVVGTLVEGYNRCFNDGEQHADKMIPEISGAIDTAPGQRQRCDSSDNYIPEYYESHPSDSRITGPREVGNSVTERYGTCGGNTPLVTENKKFIGVDVYNQVLTDDVAITVTEACGVANASGPKVMESHPNAICFEPGILKREGGNESRINDEVSSTLREQMGDNQPAVCFTQNDGGRDASVGIAPTMRSGGEGGLPSQAVCFQQNTRSEVRKINGDGQIAGSLSSEAGMNQQNYLANAQVRRLTPKECERLQAFPDDFTKIPWRGKDADNCPDSGRYKALGNSMAVNVMRWLGIRIQMVEDLG